jgi:hypothetical protein
MVKISVLNIKSWLADKWPILLVAAVYLAYKLLYFQTGMFWDSVTILSKPATYLFNTGLFHFHYPADIDNADPQLVPFYIALAWKIFGRSILVTHLAFLPILISILIAIFHLAKKIFPREWVPYIFMLVCLDPTLMSQSIGLYQDSFLILFSILSINFLIGKNRIGQAIFLLLLCMVSRRGMLLAFAFMLANFANLWLLEKRPFVKTLKSTFLPYFPADLFVIWFVIWRLYAFGWFFTTSQTNSGQLVDGHGLVRNSIVLVRWFLDDGRLGLWLAFGIIFLKSREKKGFVSNNKELISYFVVALVVMMAVTIPLANPFGARYFTIHYLIFSLILSKLIISQVSIRRSKALFILFAILLFSGNFWIYPEKNSQSWDASLSNLAYFNLKKQTVDYFENKNINIETVGVGFPLNAPFDFSELNNDKRHFNNINFKSNNWIVYSNTFNLTDEQIDTIKKLPLVQEFKNGTVFVRIYKNNNQYTK